MLRSKNELMCLVIVMFLLLMSGCGQNPVQTQTSGNLNVNIAVEYTDHAAAFYYAQGKGLFKEDGFVINDVKVYSSGVGVAAAFTKGEFDISYMCLVPAIFTYANGGVPIKIISGTHKDGYSLVVNSQKIKSLHDLEKKGVIIANGPQGTSTDFLQKMLVEKENLNPDRVLENTVRMNASKQLMALHSGKVDAVFVPEHFVSIAASFPGMEILVNSGDIWPDMQGSVLVVKDTLLNSHPDVVKKIKDINEKSIKMMNQNKQEAAEIIAYNLNLNQNMVKEETNSPEANLEVTPELIAESMTRLKSTPEITTEEVQEIINKMYSWGYITKLFQAEEIMAPDF